VSGELVTMTIDGREIHVPKGTGVVEAAAAAGVEIPVFCYEPRLGAPLGACRMCLVEVEGLPKLQAGCTLTAQDGMVVRSSAASEKAAEGQNAILEFILLNHPLDCPDCDKGGECPLQDLTFRYGPATTRMGFPKRTFDKPIPVSPLIALDRERCILCYRCTRFSEQVAEDGQLVAVNRGAASFITTFEDEPYRAHFSGNVVELCPVGALTSTVYRFRGRPWEIQNVPTVCGMCPVGCNTWATTREGKVARIMSRNHPEVDEGWLCDKGRFAHDHTQSSDRLRAPLLRLPMRGLSEVTWDEALDGAEQGLRAASGPAAAVFSGGESLEQATAISRLLRQGLRSDLAIIPDDPHPALDAFRAPLSAIRSTEVCLVVGDEPAVERAPIVDLWLRAARRAGADVITIHPAGSVPVQPGSAAWVCAELAGDNQSTDELLDVARKLRAAERVALVWSHDDPTGGAHLAALANALELGEGSGAYWLPRTPNGRGVAQAWRAAGAGRGSEPAGGAELGVLIVSGDEALRDRRVIELADRAGFVVSTSMYMTEVTGQSHVVLPGRSYLERDGTTINLEGRAQRQRRAIQPPGWDELEFFARLAQRFGVDVSPWVEAGPATHAPLPARGAVVAVEPPPARAATANGGMRVVRYRSLFSGGAVERVPQLAFQRPLPEIELAHLDAHTYRVGSGDRVRVSSNGASRELAVKVNRRLLSGVVRIADEHGVGLGDEVEIAKAT
jgi:NADH-quinone oxidoreductase subunit G